MPVTGKDQQKEKQRGVFCRNLETLDSNPEPCAVWLFTVFILFIGGPRAFFDPPRPL